MYASKGASGADIRANIDESIEVGVGESILVPTGVRVEIPDGYEIQVRPRSGLALNNSITVLNTPATIDCDYRGEIKIILINHGKKPFIIEPKMRIAQLILAKVVRANFVNVSSFSYSERGERGFGHTGI